MRLFTVVLFFVGILTIHAQPSFETSATNIGSGGTNALVNTPSGTVEDDLLVVGVMYTKGNNETITPPAGWTLIQKSDNGEECGLATYYKVAGSGEPSNYTFSFAEGSKWAIGISRISGADTSSPIHSSGKSDGKSTSISAPSITTSSDNCLILCFYTNKVDESFSPSGGTTERYDVPNTTYGSISNMMASFVQLSAGSTGAKAVTATDDFWVGQQVAIAYDGAFPIELTHFTVSTCNNSSVCVSWQTESETNNDFFTIERSKNARSWSQLSIIDGAGNSSRKISYQSEDPSPFRGTSFYRLKQTNFNGQVTFSGIQSVITDQFKSPHIQLFPNPSFRKINIKGDSAELGELQIHDMMGQNMRRFIHIIKHNETSYTIDASRLPQGMYMLRTINSSTLEVSGYKFKITRE